MEFEDIPVYQYVGKGKLKRLYEVPKGYNRFEWQIHHYIRQKWIERHKEEYEKIKHLQKHFTYRQICIWSYTPNTVSLKKNMVLR